MSAEPTENQINEVNERSVKFNKLYQSAKRNPNRSRNLGMNLSLPILKLNRMVNEIDCKIGCTYCCNLRVVAFKFEIIAIYKYVNSKMSEERLIELKHKIDKQYSQIKGMSSDEHFQTNVECPLLFDGKCSAYEVRPLACASYHSLSVNECKYSDENPTVVTDGIPKIREIEEEHVIQNTTVGRVLMHNQEEPVVLELISALKEIFDDPSQVEKWQENKASFVKTKHESLMEG